MTETVLAISLADRWHDFWAGEIGVWILTTGLHIALLLIGGLLAARFINWAAQRVVRRIDQGPLCDDEGAFMASAATPGQPLR